MNLYFKTIGSGQPLLILHGLFGSSDNWLTHAKKLGEYFKVYLIDQRNHGHSPWHEEFNYPIMAADLYELVQNEKLEDFILLGHSMGGKTAMHFSQQHEKLIEKMVIVDMGVKKYPMHHQVIIKALKSLDLNTIRTRKEAEIELSLSIDEISIRQFLLKNLYWIEKEKLAWRMNINVLEKEMKSILSGLPFKEVFTDTLFLKGEKSNYIEQSDEEEILRYFPISEIKSIQNAGHWLHAEAPNEFIQKVLEFCLR